MKARLLLVAASAAAVAVLLFFLLREQPAASPATAPGSPPAEQPAAPAAAPLQADAAGGREQQPDAAGGGREPVAGAPGWDLRGVLRTRGPIGIAGARIQIHRGSERDSRGFMEAALSAAAIDPNLPGARELRKPAFLVDDEPLTSVAADDDGSFRCDDLPLRHVRLVLDHDLWALTQPEAVDLDDYAGRAVVLQPSLGACVRGRLVGDHPLGGRKVRLRLGMDPMAPVRDPGSFLATMLRGFGEPVATDADGNFRFRAVPPSPAVRLVLLDDELCGTAGPFALAAGETREVRLRVQAGVALELQVTGEGGHALSGARVRLKSDAEKSAIAGVPDAGASTDDAGRARVGGLMPGSYQLEVEASGFVPHEETLALAEPVLRHEVALGKGASVSGIVVDPAGEPVHDAGVAAVPMLEIPVLGDLGGLVGDDMFALEARRAKCRTDAEGRFTLTGISGHRPFAVAVAHDDYVGKLHKDVRAGDVDLRVVLQPGARVVGRVVHGAEHEPLTDFEVATVVTMALVWERPTRIVPITGSKDGAFELRNVALGKATLRVRADGFAPYEQKISLQSGVVLDAGTITLVPGASVHGIVVDPQDQPVADATVRVSRGGFSDNPMFGMFTGARHATTDAQGAFTLEGLAGGRLTLIADAPGFATGRRSRITVPPAGTLRDVRIHLTTGGVIAGRLLLPPGASVASWSITAGTFTGDAVGSAGVAPDGSFRIDHLPPGAYRVQAFDSSSYGAIARQSEQSMRPGSGVDFGKLITDLMQNLVQTTCSVRDGQTTDIELDATARGGDGASLMVQVTVGERPLADGWIECTQEADGRTTMTLLERGRAELKGLGLGRHRLQVRSGWMMAPVGEPQIVEVEGEDAAQAVTIRLAGGTIAGRVLDAASGQSVGGAAVRIRAEGAIERPSDFGFAMTDPDGGFEFTGLAAGTYSLSADESFSPRGEVAGRLDRIVLRSDEERRGLVLHAERHAGVEVLVTDRTLAPVARALVIAIDAGGNPVGTFAFGFTDAEGRATFSALPPGPTRIAVRAEDHAPAVSDVQRIVRGADHEFRVEVGPGVPVRVRVETKDGNAVRGAQVACRIGDGPWLPSLLLQRAIPGEEVDLGQIPPGSVRLRIQVPGRPAFEVQRSLQGGARTTWTVTLPD